MSASRTTEPGLPLPASTVALRLAVAFAVGLPFACVTESPHSAVSSAQGATQTLAHAEADRLLAEGRELWATRRPEALLESLERFDRVLAAFPERADAHSARADSLCLIGLYDLMAPTEAMPGCRDSAARAIELEPDLARAHASLGLALYLHDWNFVRAQAAFERAHELDPSYAAALHWHAMLHRAQGRHDRAIELMRRAVAEAPSSPLLATKLGTALTSAGSYDEAGAQLESTLQEHPNSGLALREMAWVHLVLQRPAAALELLERAAKSASIETRVARVVALAQNGRAKEARDELERIHEEEAEDLSPVSAAVGWVGLGELEEAMVQLERAHERRDPGLVYLRAHPGLRALQSHPGFGILAGKVGLQTEAPAE